MPVLNCSVRLSDLVVIWLQRGALLIDADMSHELVMQNYGPFKVVYETMCGTNDVCKGSENSQEVLQRQCTVYRYPQTWLTVATALQVFQRQVSNYKLSLFLHGSK